VAEARPRHPTGPIDSAQATRIDLGAVSGLADATLCGRYHLERLIGSGGMAQVWEATDLVLGRQVAVKVLHPHLSVDDALVTRFRQEAVAAARLSHPGIVGVYDTCSDGSNEAIVMELLDASTLRQHLDEHGALDAETTVRIALRLLDALEAAHRAGLVHRDVKPSNILLCRDGRVKIADFGIAKAEDQTELTQEGTLVGTATYLAPEQLLGGDVDGRTDLYSLGIVLYECLTGHVPFRGETGAAVALARLHSDPVDPRRFRADVPTRVSDPIMRVLQRRPEDRFDSAADLRAALLDTGVPAVVPPPTPTPLPELEIEDEPTEERESFARTERGWLVPALFILLIATAITVAGLLLRETAIGDDDEDTASTTSSAPSTATSDVELSAATPYDPQGRGTPGENDEAAVRVLDGDPGTGWRTESYDTPDFFGSKTGVGLGLLVGAPTSSATLALEGSTNGWSARVLVVPADEVVDGRPDGIDPDDLEPVAELEDVRGPVEVPLGVDTLDDGDLVLVWITDLGEPVDSGRHRVEVAEARLRGADAPGG
jgi:serine/threonine-protein kinase